MVIAANPLQGMTSLRSAHELLLPTLRDCNSIRLPFTVIVQIRSIDVWPAVPRATLVIRQRIDTN